MVVDGEKERMPSKTSHKLGKRSLGADLSINTHFEGVVYEQQNRDEQEFKSSRKQFA